jgi:hypothetical protein
MTDQNKNLPPEDGRFSSELAALFRRQLRHPRLAAEPANPLKHARREQNASGRWHSSLVTRVTLFHPTADKRGCFRIFNKLAL